ncbi:MAG: hypothetical protein WA354_07380 [Terracidiphilus sp.]
MTLSIPNCILCSLLFSAPLFAVAQLAGSPASQNQPPDPAIVAATTAKLAALRDAFVQEAVREAKSAGSACTLDAPKLEIADIPSFGNYDPASNTLRVSAWWLLNADQKELFFHLAGPNADDQAANRVFNNGTYSWVFVHELGHWWQACFDSAQNKTHYQREYDANRIAAAYWREHDPALLQGLVAGFTRILAGAPNPVPAGQTPEEYFNANYEKLAHSSDYVWFQARMVTDVNAEIPPPTFAVGLLHSQMEKK